MKIYLRSVLAVIFNLCNFESAFAQDLRDDFIRNSYSGIILNKVEDEWVSECSIKKQPIQVVSEKLFDIKEKIKITFKDEHPYQNIHSIKINARMIFDGNKALNIDLVQIKIFHYTSGYAIRGIPLCQTYLVRPDWSIMKQISD